MKMNTIKSINKRRIVNEDGDDGFTGNILQQDEDIPKEDDDELPPRLVTISSAC